jgi:hypothetical protein
VFQLLLLTLCICISLRGQTSRAKPLRPEDTPALPAEDETAQSAVEPETTKTDEPEAPAAVAQPVRDWLEMQVELSRSGFLSRTVDR